MIRKKKKNIQVRRPRKPVDSLVQSHKPLPLKGAACKSKLSTSCLCLPCKYEPKAVHMNIIMWLGFKFSLYKHVGKGGLSEPSFWSPKHLLAI